MTQEEILTFSKKFKRKFEKKHLKEIEKWLVDAGDTEMENIKKSVKSPLKIDYYAFFLHMFAIDRFILRQPILAILKIIWVWGFFAIFVMTGIIYLWIAEGLWPFFDWVTARARTRNYNYKVVKTILNKE